VIPITVSGEGRVISEAASQHDGSGSIQGHVGFVVDEVAMGRDFSDLSHQFPFHQRLHTHTIRGWYNRPSNVC
jgi:hypothetical protein